jgi:hypothetical protein
MKVTCKIQNASENINGITFMRQEDGSVVATGVSAEDAATFSGIEGYAVEDEVVPGADEQDVATPNAKKSK